MLLTFESVCIAFAYLVMSLFFCLFVYFYLQISHKYGLIYVITKLGLLFVYDLETAAAVYRNRISSDPIFLTSEATSVGGFYAINRRGQVLLATINDATIVPFVSGQVCLFAFALYPMFICFIYYSCFELLLPVK